MLEQIQKVKHDFKRLVPVTMELMFDACIGILAEEFMTKRSELDARARKTGQFLKLDLLHARNEADFKHDKELILRLKGQVLGLYTEAKNESEKNQKEGTEGSSQLDGLGAAPPSGENDA
jgi:hypothetical protein